VSGGFVIDIDTDDSFLDADEIEYDDGTKLSGLVEAPVVVNPDGSVTVKPNPSGASRPDPGTPEAGGARIAKG
jgi:hypothetical protein